METWPDSVRLMLREDKERTFANTYALDDPFAGPPYLDDITDDEPVSFSGKLVLDRRMAQRFYVFWNDINRGKDRFLMPIHGEFGVFEQECQALPGSFRRTTEIAQDIFEYNIDIIVPEWKPIGDNDYDYIKDFIKLGWVFPTDFNIFDIVVNEQWPEA